VSTLSKKEIAMKKTLLNVSLAAALALASVSAGAPFRRAAVERAYAPASDDALSPIKARGNCAVRVRHALTGEPLAGLPVYLERATTSPSDQVAPALVGRTGSDGIAEFKQVSQGQYRVYVLHNNIMSDVARIAIRGGATTYVTLAFNPDID
jgi:hypothetical protein